MVKDSVRRFIFENLGIRGEIVRLEHSYQSVLERHPYPAVLAELLGQAMAAITLLGTTIKYQGKLILQVQGAGPANLLVVEYDSQRHIRGLVNWRQGETLNANIGELFGAGHMAISAVPQGHADSQDKSSRYQGIVELAEPSLAACIEHYFKQSEQLTTCLWLLANDKQAAGLLLQQMPSATMSASDWQRIKLLAETVSNEELLTLDEEALLHRLFNEDDIRLFEREHICFHCGCSRERVEQMLHCLGRDEVESIIAEQGSVEVACEYCNKHYSFDPVDTAQLFATGDLGFHSDTRH